MKRSLGLFLAGSLAAAASLADMKTYYALEVKGGSRVYALDTPVRKGRLYLFHRYPDGVFLSLAASEVDRVVPLEAPPPAPSDRLAPGETLYVGNAVEGPHFETPAAPRQPDAYAYPDSGYGYYGDYPYWGGGYVPPRPPVPAPPSRIGPNGYPILAPPGSPGSVPPPIGPNGYPVLAPPPVPAPRRR